MKHAYDEDGAGTGDPHELAALYAVDALEPAERTNFEGHLLRCPRCREEVAGYADAGAQLAAATASAPPPALRTSVLAAIHGTRPGDVPASGKAPEDVTGQAPADAPAAPSRDEHAAGVASLDERRRRRNRRLLAAAAAAVLVPGIAFAGWSLGAQQERQEQQQAADQEQDRENQLLAAPDVTARTLDVNGQPATLVYSREQGRALFISAALPDPGEGQEYQLWLLEDGTALPDVRFSGGTVRTWLTGDLASAGGAALTAEPEGGSAAPTYPLLAAVEL
ncbi:anti-sigma factor domain-containing protein [Arthrobacter sp. 7Tela_A1]|uniref:anti-sigma factor n=1 Tax=Arthrobacter sp. 7Tela_A1 TaxID=3093745 RepID=UPI003BB59771